MTTWAELTSQTLESSYWFEDDLCHALLDYNVLLDSNQSYYQDLIDERTNLLNDLSSINQQLNDKEIELTNIRETIDIKQSNNQDASTELQTERNLESDYDSLENQRDSIETLLNDNLKEINNLSQSLDMTNHFTEDQLIVLDSFTNTDVWTNENISDPEELLNASIEQFATINHPKTNLKISLVDLLKIADIPDDIDVSDWLGKKINIYYEPFNINVQTQVIEMDINYDTGSVDLVIANTTKVKKNKNEELADLIYNNATIAGQVTRDKYKWDKAPQLESELFDFLNNKFNAAKQEIVAGANETVTINERGITVTDSEDPLRLIRITNSVIGLIRGGNYVGTAITPDGVWADHVIGKLLLGEKLLISDEDGTFEIDGNLLTVKDRGNVERVLLGEYEDDKFGLKLMNKTGQEVVLDENGILQTWQPSGRADNVDASNGLTLNIYLPNDTISVRKALLNFKLLPFRSYSSTTASGGSSSVTSASGGGTSKTSGAGGDHNHLMFSIVGFTSDDSPNNSAVSGVVSDTGSTLKLPANNAAGQYYTQGSSGNHSHSVTLENHTHNVQIPAHSHGIQHGIYTSTSANNVGIIINGVNRTSVLGGQFTTDQSNIDITQYMQIGQWNEIELTSDRLGRIDANIFIQAFMST